MRLQSDPTIIYGIAGGQGGLGRGITKSDIESKSPYNTYQINGLPPGPICNPGKSALLAALHPAKTSDLYFVADGSGGHTFSETLKEHNTAVQKWREHEKEIAKARQDDEDNKDGKDDPVPIPGGKGGSAQAKAPEPEQNGKATKAAQNQAPVAAGDAPSSPASEASSGVTDIPMPVRKPKRQ
jgi:UPF0755 protein